jgi:Ca2+-binding RTX toxin-like protein
MRTLSRRTGGRRGARLAAVLAGTLLTYLVATAVPASAAGPSCAVNGGNPAILDVFIDTDYTVALAVSDGSSFGLVPAPQYAIAVQNPGNSLFGPWTSCGAGATPALIDWVNVTGSNAGNEHLILFRPAAALGENITVNLGNGSDSFTVDYGGFTSPPYTTTFGDPATPDYPNLGTSATGALVMDLDSFVPADAEVRVDNAETVRINGGAGNDTIDAGNDWNMTASPGLPLPVTGDDIPAATSPWSAPLVVNGGNGDDQLNSGSGNDTFNGGPGVDSIWYSSFVANGFTAPGPVTVDLAAGTGTGMGNDTLTDVQNVVGSSYGDTLTGNSLDNYIDGADGNDTINGATGNDTLFGGSDDPIMTDANAHGGNDTFVEGTGANGSDTVNGGDGVGDTVDLSGRTNSLYVEPGSSPSSGEGGCPLGAGCEKDTYGTDNEIYLLGSGNDTFVGSVSDEWVVPGAGDDSVDGNGGFDYLDLSDAAGPATFDLTTWQATGNGTDTLADVEGFVGTDADDQVLFDDGLGCDFDLTSITPCDFIGGAGIDTLDGSATTAGFTVDLSQIGDSHDVENVIGGSGDDLIYGNDVANALFGGDGFDSIDAGLGNDTVEGGLDNDILDGGPGGDTLVYTHSTAGMIIDNQLGFTQGIGGVGDGQDTIGFFEIVLGSDFGDEITAGQTAFDANNRLLGRGGDDTLIGTNSSDLLKGGAGDDYQRGGGGDDDVYGGPGDDILLGSSGDDFLKGGKGSDTGNGGRGADICKSVEFPKSC